MNLVVSRVDKRDRALSCEDTQSFELLRMLVDLRSVTTAKLLPPGRIVAEPFPQCSAGSDVLLPLIDIRVCLLHAARPQPVDQYPGAVIRSGRLISPLKPDIIRRNPRVHQHRSE